MVGATDVAKVEVVAKDCISTELTDMLYDPKYATIDSKGGNSRVSRELTN
jgi:hypothetical protein